eukprot:TRINITY_DN2780_c0_g1_i5.p2 TRINITY_DN2780_c0_g1~~TRINITY_DN2780_c0_g1_i5.p2  ORF type:complete len:104 (+),score=2.57 TRINITY_DN2780_c0_g1_i5:25-312(+)
MLNLRTFCLATLSLFIEDNNIEVEGAKEIGLALQNNNALTTLNLSMLFVQLFLIDYNEIRGEGAKEIGHALQKNKTLTTLNLSMSFVQHYFYPSQ